MKRPRRLRWYLRADSRCRKLRARRAHDGPQYRNRGRLHIVQSATARRQPGSWQTTMCNLITVRSTRCSTSARTCATQDKSLCDFTVPRSDRGHGADISVSSLCASPTTVPKRAPQREPRPFSSERLGPSPRRRSWHLESRLARGAHRVARPPSPRPPAPTRHAEHAPRGQRSHKKVVRRRARGSQPDAHTGGVPTR